ncbi:MAG: D-Ala-D-Ala carboxypeptidase family metallohydrolase [Actinomycetota bacterium]
MGQQMFHKTFFIAAFVAACVLLTAAPAFAYDFNRTLQEGDSGEDVVELQVRVAGWLPRADQRRLRLNGIFNRKTTNSVKAFQRHYGLTVDGIAGPSVFDVLNSLEMDNGSTLNFAWKEFKQNYNSRCSGEANKYARTFKGGKVGRIQVRENVRRMMWRLEALRAKGGDNPIGINSAFRSVAYNACIGGASLSQHMYGTAVDMKVANVTNRTSRDTAKGTQFHGISCYSSLSHNHLDLRLDNDQLPQAQFWWWPERDAKGRDLADDGKPCYGETAQEGPAPRTDSGYAPTARETQDFNDGHEPHYGGLAD